jgi:hypothetical protein
MTDNLMAPGSPAGTMRNGRGSPWRIGLIGRQPPHHQPDQLAGGQDDRPLVAVHAHLVELPVEGGGILGVAHPDRVSRLTEGIPQVTSAGPGQARLFRLQVGRWVLMPLEPGLCGNLGRIRIEPLAVAQLAEHTSGQDGANARDGLQGMGDGRHALGDGRLQASHLALEHGDGLQAQPEAQGDGGLQSGRQVGRVARHLREPTPGRTGICNAAFALAVDELDELVEGQRRHLLEGGQFLEHGTTGRAEDVREGLPVSVLAGCEGEGGQAIGLLPDAGRHPVGAVAGEKAPWQGAVLDLEGRGQVPAQT